METKVIKVNPREIKLLEVNARFMKADEFQKLVENVKRDGCLTQLPFCTYNEDWELEVLSGNHRVQAAIEAGLEEIDVQVTEEELTKDQRIGIQLSHNAISGQDDMAILKQLYESIDDVNYKKYSGLDDETLQLLEEIKTQSMSSIGLEYQILNIMFLPSEVKDIKKIVKQAVKECRKNETLTLRMAEYDKYLDTMNEVAEGSRIRNTAVAFMAMLEIVQNHMEELKDCWIDDAKDKEYVPISTIIGRSSIKASEGRVVDKAVERLLSKGEIKKDSKESALAILAQKYLESEGKWKEPKEENVKNNGKKSKKPIDK